MRRIRAVPIVATLALALAGLVSVQSASPPANAGPLNSGYLMKITGSADDTTTNWINGINYNYLTYPGFDVFMYNNGYNGMFGDEHLSGITLTLNGQRIAGNGDIHLLPAVEQWDAAQPDNSTPLYVPSGGTCTAANNAGWDTSIWCSQSRKYNYSTNTIRLPMRYVYDSQTLIDPAVGNNALNWPQMKYDLVAMPEPGGVNLQVILRDDLPEQLEDSASFMLEFIPSLYKNKSYQIDTDGNGSYDAHGILPLAPEDPMDEDWPRADLTYSAWYVEQWNNDKGNQQPSPLGRGYGWTFSAEDPTTRVSVTADQLLSVYDGRNRSQNGWFGMSSRIPKGSRAGQTVASWHIQAPVQSNWVREPSIGHSQAGYTPNLPKIAVVESDRNQPVVAGDTATLLRLNADGTYTSVFTGALGPARVWARYNYRDFDFSTIKAPGIYAIEYGGVRTSPFPINDNVYDKVWQPSISGYMATAMDHMALREGYKIWHGAAHMDDARMGEHFQNTIEAKDGQGNPTGSITWFDGQSVALNPKIPQKLKDKGLYEGTRVPGINQGGWFDAGDFDIEVHSNLSTLRNLITDAQTFDNLDDYDNLSVEWNYDTGGDAEMHRPDGVPDIVQQVKHGALFISALIENVGWAGTGVIEVPTLRQYTHLGDGSTDTDGYVYDKTLDPDEVVERNGVTYSGKNDDRMVMIYRGAQAGQVPTALSGNPAFDLAGAAAVLKGYDDVFGARCLEIAKTIWTEEEATMTAANKFNFLIELILAAEAYADPMLNTFKAEYQTLLGIGNPFMPGGARAITNNMPAMLVMDAMGPAYTQMIVDALDAYAALPNNPWAPVAGTPFGFAENLTATWGPSSSKVPGAAARIYKNLTKRNLHSAALAPMRDQIVRGVNYILGTHPYNDTSWLVGSGADSHKHPYNSNRADEGYIPGSLVPGYINFRPDFPESLDNFSFLWAENEATVGSVSGWIPAGKAIAEIAHEVPNTEAPAASQDFNNSFMMTAEETQAMNPYTGQPDLPYEVLTTPGFDVFMYNTTFSQIFGDQHAAGVELVLNGQRLATNGDIHLLPTPEQWDATPAPILENRASNPATNEVSATLTLPGTEDGTKVPVEYTMKATPEPGGFKLTVELDRPLPPDLAGKAGFNLELIPNLYKEKSFQADTDGNGSYDDFGIVPLMPFDELEEKERARTDDQKWYVKEWNRDRGDYQPVPITTAKTITLAPETENRIRFTSDDGDIELLDGRNRSQNGWFVLRTLFGNNATSLTWHVRADVDPGWTRTVNIGHSQAGYTPNQTKQAVMELDPAGTQPANATVRRVNADGSFSTAFSAPVGPAKRWLRYDYRTFDFSEVTEPGLYVIDYAGERSEVFPIDEGAYAKSWQQSLSGFLAKQMDHIWVRDAYKINHAASHMDDAIMWPLCGEPFRSEASFDGSWFDGQDYCPTSRTNNSFNSLEHIPGLAKGGWFDAGDYDLEATRQAGVIQDLAIAYREFHPDYDTMDVHWADASGGMVELHRGDGVPDIVQQVRHGVLNVIARFDAIGYNFKVVEVPTLRQYTHLGDAYTETDNKIYDPSLNENQVVGLRSGKQDDRLAMVGEKDPSLQYYGAYAMAAAATVLEGYDDELAAKALRYAKGVWDTEELVLEVPTCPPGDFMCIFTSIGQMAAEFNAAVELALATNGEQRYLDAIETLFPIVSAPMGFGASFASGGWKAAFVLDYMDDTFKAAFKEAAIAYKAAYDASTANNPFGVSDTVGMWGGSTDVVDMGETMYFMHKLYPELFSTDYTLRAANYILGTHPDNNSSWVTGVGTDSVQHAYGNNRAEDFYIAGGVVPGYVPMMPDLPEAQADFGMMWFESEYVIDTAAKWVVLGNAANVLGNEDPTVSGPASPVNGAKTVLNAVIAGTAGLNASEFTASSWAGYQAALAAAEAVAAPGSGATLAEIEAAQTRLQTALSVLQPAPTVTPPPVDNSAANARAVLTSTLAMVGGLSQGDYTAASWQVFSSALDAARSVSGDSAASAAALQAASQALSLAAGLLQPASAGGGGASSARDQAISQIDALIAATAGLREADFTPASWQALQAALTNARTVRGDPSATAAHLGAVHQAIVAALGDLAKPAAPPAQTPPPQTPPTTQPPAPGPSASPGPDSSPDPNAPVTAVKAPQTQLRLVLGKATTIPILAYNADGSLAKVTWKSSNPKVATVSASGKITAKKTGKTTITATAGGKSTSVVISVVAKKKAGVKSVSAKVPTTMKIGQVALITGKYKPATATGVKVTYKSNKSSVASIDRAGRLVAKKAGKVNITVKAGKVSKKYKVTVK